jgi:hypothetical protein
MNMPLEIAWLELLLTAALFCCWCTKLKKRREILMNMPFFSSRQASPSAITKALKKNRKKFGPTQ